MHKWILFFVGTLSVSFILTSIALADAIDGDWCDSNGKRMSIRGPSMVTPGGQQISGNYSRHYFSYIIRAGETDAGATVEIQLLSEYLVHLRQGNDPSVHEWRRCQPGVSKDALCRMSAFDPEPTLRLLSQLMSGFGVKRT